MKMPSSCSALVPLAVVLFGTSSLQGCKFNHLPPSVQIAIGHGCVEKADAVTEKDALKNSGMADGCDGLDQDKLKALELTSCDEVLKRAIRWATEVECEGNVGHTVSDACETVDADCKKAVDSEVEAWKVSAVEDEKEEKEGFEAVLALIAACHKGVREKIDNLGEDGPGAEACSDVHTGNLTIMGITDEHCKEYRKKQRIDMDTIVCTDWCLNQEDAPDADAVTLDYLKTTVGAHFEQADGSAEAADRLRLFETAMKSKKWPQKFQPWSNKIAKFGGVILAALAALVIVGIKRRARHVEADEFLTTIE